jgi:hypothetical protein
MSSRRSLDGRDRIKSKHWLMNSSEFIIVARLFVLARESFLPESSAGTRKVLTSFLWAFHFAFLPGGCTPYIHRRLGAWLLIPARPAPMFDNTSDTTERRRKLRRIL